MGVGVRYNVNAYNFNFYVYYPIFYILRFILLFLEVLYHLNALPHSFIFFFIYFKRVVKVHISFNFVIYIRILLVAFLTICSFRKTF